MGQVKQLTMIHRRIANELPPFVAHGSHESLIRQEDRVTDLPCLRGPQGPKIETGHSGRNRQTRKTTHRREHVKEIGEGCRGAPSRNAGSSDDERAPHAVLVDVLLTQQPMTAQG